MENKKREIRNKTISKILGIFLIAICTTRSILTVELYGLKEVFSQFSFYFYLIGMLLGSILYYFMEVRK